MKDFDERLHEGLDRLDMALPPFRPPRHRMSISRWRPGWGWVLGALAVAAMVAFMVNAFNTSGVKTILQTQGGPVPGNPNNPGVILQTISPDPNVVPPTLPPGFVVHAGDTVIWPPGGTPYLVTPAPSSSR